MSGTVKCLIHPTYKGKGKPTSLKEGCICAQIWLAKNTKQRAGVHPTKVIPDKTKYKRKLKHKKAEDEDEQGNTS